jgi:hypothetical protein
VPLCRPDGGNDGKAHKDFSVSYSHTSNPLARRISGRAPGAYALVVGQKINDLTRLFVELHGAPRISSFKKGQGSRESIDHVVISLNGAPMRWASGTPQPAQANC